MTAQFPEILNYEGEEYAMFAEPLDIYLEGREGLVSDVPVCTACKRNYLGKWEIKGNRLYLTDLRMWLDEEGNEMERIFPGQKEVFAGWFSGEIRLVHGKLLKDAHTGVDSMYEEELFLEIKDGELAGVRSVGVRK